MKEGGIEAGLFCLICFENAALVARWIKIKQIKLNPASNQEGRKLIPASIQKPQVNKIKSCFLQIRGLIES